MLAFTGSALSRSGSVGLGFGGVEPRFDST